MQKHQEKNLHIAFGFISSVHASYHILIIAVSLIINNSSELITYLKLETVSVNIIFIRFICRAINFYRAMHFSAKRGIAIACRLSVRPSVRL